MLWRIHAASALLVVPQATVGTFALVFLVDSHGWAPSTAGRVLAAGQVGGAVARGVAGWWSDRARARVRPMRLVALTITGVVALLAVSTHSAVALAALLAAGVLTVSPNGLAFTAVAEHAGQSWAGRALGIQNTVQNLAAIATTPAMATVIAASGYGAAFAATIAFPLAAAVVIPVSADRGADISPSPRPSRRRVTAR